MHQVPPYTLWLGHAGDGRNFRRINDEGIHAIVFLAMEEPLPQVPRDLVFCRFPILDGIDNSEKIVRLAIDTVARLVSNKIPTLVVCSAGMSRSPAIAAAALSLVDHKPPEEMITTIRKIIPCDLSPALWSEILAVLAAW